MITRNVCLIVVILSCVSWIQIQGFKKFSLYKQEVEIKVPSNWKIDKNYPEFSNYQLKQCIKIWDKKTTSVLIADVYDSSHMYETPITVDMLTELEEIQRKTKGPIRTMSKEVIKVDEHNVGLLKYTFLNAKGSKCFGMQMVFRISFDSFYEIEIYSLIQPANEFEVLATQIANSLHIKK